MGYFCFSRGPKSPVKLPLYMLQSPAPYPEGWVAEYSMTVCPLGLLPTPFSSHGSPFLCSESPAHSHPCLHGERYVPGLINRRFPESPCGGLESLVAPSSGRETAWQDMTTTPVPAQSPRGRTVTAGWLSTNTFLGSLSCCSGIR